MSFSKAKPQPVNLCQPPETPFSATARRARRNAASPAASAAGKWLAFAAAAKLSRLHDGHIFQNQLHAARLEIFRRQKLAIRRYGACLHHRINPPDISGFTVIKLRNIPAAEIRLGSKANLAPIGILLIRPIRAQ